MKIKMLLVASVLVASPSLALAMGCNWGSHAIKEDVAMSCAEGTVWDTDAKNCVPLTTG